MKLKILSEKIKITPAIKDYIEEKICKLDKYFDSPDNVEAKVMVRIKNNNQIIEVTVPTKLFTLRSEESHSDLYAAIDLVIDKLEGQFRKHKTRLNDRYKKGAKEKDFIFDFENEDAEENKSKIVKRKTIDSKPMDEEEAILQMELLGHDFFIFKNVDEDCFSVIYKRKDGEYGIINTL
ncbi:MAG: ribosome-associated translation inhibitor RaiA [Mollicutes bacterium]|jgi:putative sigma-54 modulation protein|nr:ribosome-associated translation inhibitor RaiA [Mollicutes bacterium]